MEDLAKKIQILSSEVTTAAKKVDIDRLESELKKLQTVSLRVDFWSDRASAEINMRDQARLSEQLKPWQKLLSDIKELNELVKLKDRSLQAEITKQFEETAINFDHLKGQLRFNEPHDQGDAFLSIHSGAGGVDAQDWAEMLLRMYLRWAAKAGMQVKILSQSSGEEAGIKSVDVEIDGQFAYGQLKGEHGVHRLVRLSPFNADHLRETSFAKVEVLPKISQSVNLKIDDKNLKIDVFRSGGRGGQSVNTTDSAVRITHLPTGLNVTIQNERSQLQNKELAMTVLRSKLTQLLEDQHQKELDNLKGPNQSAEWGNQIRSYVLHPYKQVKDLRTGFESKDPSKVLDGNIESFIEAYLEYRLEA